MYQTKISRMLTITQNVVASMYTRDVVAHFLFKYVDGFKEGSRHCACQCRGSLFESCCLEGRESTGGSDLALL
jgi:hypothetical protein